MKKLVILLALVIAVPAFAAPTKAKKKISVPSAQAPAASEADIEDYKAGVFTTGRLEVEPTLFGLSFMSPTTVNAYIKDINKNFQDNVGAKGFTLTEFGASFRFGGSVLYKAFTRASLGFGFHRISTSTETSSTINGKTYTGNIGIGASLLTVESRIQLLRQDALEVVLSPSIGWGFYQGNSEFGGNGLNKVQTAEYGANGIVFGAAAGTRYWFSQNVGAGLSAGYRFAKSPNLKVKSESNSGQAVNSDLENDGKKIQVDASGFELGANIVISL